MRISTFLHDYEDSLVTKWIIPALEGRNEIVRQDKCICQLTTQPERGELGDLVFVHPHDTNKGGCYDKISRFVDQYLDLPFYICALQDDSRKEPRIQGIGKHANVTYITDQNCSELLPKLMEK